MKKERIAAYIALTTKLSRFLDASFGHYWRQCVMIDWKLRRRDSSSTIYHVISTVNTLRPRQMSTIFQTTVSNTFPLMIIYEFRFKFHCRLFLRVWSLRPCQYKFQSSCIPKYCTYLPLLICIAFVLIQVKFYETGCFSYGAIQSCFYYYQSIAYLEYINCKVFK